MTAVRDVVIGKRNRIDDYDLPRIGHMIGVGEDEIHALIDVESNGRPFDRNGRVTMLYEKHIFNRQLPKIERPAAIKKRLARTRWVRDYPADSYPIFFEAARFNRQAAFESCSWGIMQTMGFNYKLCGFTSAEEMVEAYADDEANQLQGGVEFIKNTGIAADLRAHRWEAVARKYNGPGYKRNNYHKRLEAAYEWWSKKPDTPWTPHDAVIEEEVGRVVREASGRLHEVEDKEAGFFGRLFRF